MGEDGILLTPSEVGSRLRVSSKMVLKWIKADQIEAIDVSQNGDGSRWKITERALEKFIASRSTQ